MSTVWTGTIELVVVTDLKGHQLRVQHRRPDAGRRIL
jgi:hypothetical protein